MKKKHLKELVVTKDKFIVIAEFVPLPGNRLGNFEKFLKGYAQKKSELPDDVVLAGVTIPQSPSGVASLSPADIYSLLEMKPAPDGPENSNGPVSLWQDLDVVPHITAKDQNVDAIKTYMIGLQKLGLESVLALTGDKPAESKGVFEIDSIGLIELITGMNQQAFEKARPDSFDKVHQFYIAAAVSPFKYTEASLIQQYYKMVKKIRAGADCLITQMGWDSRKSEELFCYLNDENINVPVFGNVYFLTTMTPAPRLMREGKLPGCVVTDELFDRLRSESPAQHLERAAQQVAMYRDLGAVGVDLGGIFDFDMLLEIMDRAKEIGNNWREHKDNLDFGLETVLMKTGPRAGKEQPGFYLYDTDGSRRLPSHPRPTFNKRSFDLFHNLFLEPGRGLYPALKLTLGMSKGLREGKGCLYKMFFAGFEKPIKTMLFDCEECGDCFLVENYGICSMGKCEKGLANSPCGDAEPDGTCGNNPDIQCVGELIYNAAASERSKGTADYEGQSGLKKLQGIINPPRLQALENTSSILNYLFGRDHTKKLDFLQIAENLNAHLPKAYAAMRQLLELGPGALERPSPALSYLISLIEAQVCNRADYILINVDSLAEDDTKLAVELMNDYVRLVKKHGRDVPVCIDSRDERVLTAGLEQWYQDFGARSGIPLFRSVSGSTADNIFPLRQKHPFKVVISLMDDGQSDSENACSADKLFDTSKRIFDKATGKYGFVPDDLFFEVPVCSLMDDIPAAPEPGAACRSFEAIHKIMTASGMKGVHTLFDIAACTKGLPGRRIGVCRAWLDKARQFGLDTAVVNVLHQYGLKPSAPDLLDLADAFAMQDGSQQAYQRAQKLLDDFCRANRKAKPKKG